MTNKLLLAATTAALLALPMAAQAQGTVRGAEEFVSVPRRVLLIESCRRDSFLLRPAAPT